MSTRRIVGGMVIAVMLVCGGIDVYNLSRSRHEWKEYNALMKKMDSQDAEMAASILDYNSHLKPGQIALSCFSPSSMELRMAYMPRQRPLLSGMLPIPLLLLVFILGRN